MGPDVLFINKKSSNIWTLLWGHGHCAGTSPLACLACGINTRGPLLGEPAIRRAQEEGSISHYMTFPTPHACGLGAGQATKVCGDHLANDVHVPSSFIVVTCKWHNIAHLHHLKYIVLRHEVYSVVQPSPPSISTLFFFIPNWNFELIKRLPFPIPQPLGTTIFLSVSVNFTLRTWYKWIIHN